MNLDTGYRITKICITPDQDLKFLEINNQKVDLMPKVLYSWKDEDGFIVYTMKEVPDVGSYPIEAVTGTDGSIQTTPYPITVVGAGSITISDGDATYEYARYSSGDIEL